MSDAAIQALVTVVGKAIAGAVITALGADWADTIDGIAYAGFDASQTAITLATHYQAWCNADSTRQAADANVFAQHIVLMIMLLFVRGSKLTAQTLKETVKDENNPRVAFMVEMLTAYHVQPTGVLKTRKQGQKIITLPRIAATFPRLAVGVLSSLGDGVIKYDHLRLEVAGFVWPGSVGAIMPGITDSALHFKLCLVHSISFAVLVKGEKDVPKAAGFVQLAYEGDVPCSRLKEDQVAASWGPKQARAIRGVLGNLSIEDITKLKWPEVMALITDMKARVEADV
jgi:hypothetical protein